MASVLDFLAQANASINQAAKEQAHREALAAAFLNVPAQDPAVKQLANRAQQMMEADRQAKAPTAQQQMRGALADRGHAAAPVSPQQSSALADAAAKAAKGIAEEIDARERNLDAASAYLGILDKTDPAVRRLAQGMDGLLKKQTTGVEAFRKSLDGVQKSMVFAVAANAAFDVQLKRMTQSASPGLIRAWGGAWDILVAELGSELLPVVMSTTDTLFGLVDIFEGLDGTTKKLIAYGVLAVPAVALLGHSVRALAPAAYAAGLGIKALYASLGPLGLLMAGLSVAAAGVSAYQFYNSRGETDTKEAERAGTQVSGPQAQEAFEDMSIGNRRSVVGGFLPSAEDATDRFMQMTAEEKREKAKAARASAARLREFNSPKEAASFERIAEVLDRAAQHGTTSGDEERRGKREASLTRQARHYNTMIAEARREQRPAYSGLAEARKSLQLQTLGKGPIEQKLLDIQRKNIPKMNERLNGIMRQLEEMNRRDRQ